MLALCGLPVNRHHPLSTLFYLNIVVFMASAVVNVQVQPQNYAKALLINSFGLALAFTLIYVPLFGVFVFKAIKNPTYVLWITAFFCQGSSELFESASVAGIDGSRSPQCASFRSRCGRCWRRANLLAKTSIWYWPNRLCMVLVSSVSSILRTSWFSTGTISSSTSHRLHKTDRSTDNSSKKLRAARRSRGSPRTDTLSDSPWSLPFRSVSLAPSRRTLARSRAPSTLASI